MKIIATTLSGLFLKKEAWNNAHLLWYKNAAKELNDNSILKWVNKKDYFIGVDEVMQRLYPKLDERDRTIKARRSFFDSVIQYIKNNASIKNDDIIEFFISLKKKYKIALITTNTSQAINSILQSAGLTNLFDIIEASNEEEKDDKILVFKRFIEKHGKPIVYIGGDKKDSFDYCKENSIPCIFANLEQDKDIPGVMAVHNLEELKKELINF
jgi:phosphoglycolate phosphatase-like HAD superfamily hydrolase